MRSFDEAQKIGHVARLMIRVVFDEAQKSSHVASVRRIMASIEAYKVIAELKTNFLYQAMFLSRQRYDVSFRVVWNRVWLCD